MSIKDHITWLSWMLMEHSDSLNIKLKNKHQDVGTGQVQSIAE